MGTDPLSMLRAFKEAEARKQQEEAATQPPTAVESSSATLAMKSMLSVTPDPAPAAATVLPPPPTSAPPVRQTTAAAQGTDPLSMLRAYKERQAAEEASAAQAAEPELVRFQTTSSSELFEPFHFNVECLYYRWSLPPRLYP